MPSLNYFRNEERFQLRWRAKRLYFAGFFSAVLERPELMTFVELLWPLPVRPIVH